MIFVAKTAESTATESGRFMPRYWRWTAPAKQGFFLAAKERRVL